MLSLRWTPDGPFCFYILDLLDGPNRYNSYRSHPWAFHFPTWAKGVVAQWTNPLTRASGFDYIFSTSAFQALAGGQSLLKIAYVIFVILKSHAYFSVIFVILVISNDFFV